MKAEAVHAAELKLEWVMRSVFVGLVVFASLGAAPALGATATASFQVHVTLQASCSVNSATGLDFGAVASTAAVLDATSTIQIQCSNGTPYSIGLDAGGNGGTIPNRLMKSGSATAIYSMYQDSSRQSLWGDTGSQLVTSTGNGAAQNFTVYGRMPAQPSPAPGFYTDTVTITLSY